ncbi:hypothetical protein GCM10027321_19880 [Massilia terrae]
MPWLLARRKKKLRPLLRHRWLSRHRLRLLLRLTLLLRPLRLLLTLLLPLRLLLRLLRKPLRLLLLLLRLLRSNQFFLIKKTGLRAGFFSPVLRPLLKEEGRSFPRTRESHFSERSGNSKRP